MKELRRSLCSIYHDQSLTYFQAKYLPDVILPPQSQVSSLHNSYIVIAFLLPYSGRLNNSPPKVFTL